MSLITQLTEHMKTAMKSKDMERLGAIRFVLSQVKNAQIDAGRDLQDTEVMAVISKEVKKIQEAVREFAAGGRNDLVQEESRKLAVLTEFLPKQLSDSELEAVVAEVMAKMEDGLTLREMGQIIKLVTEKTAGAASGGRIAALVKRHLS